MRCPPRALRQSKPPRGRAHHDGGREFAIDVMFTVGVFQDVEWADRGLTALITNGFALESLTILAKASPDASSLIEKHLGCGPTQLDISGLGPAVACGPLIETLQGSDEGLRAKGLSKTFARAGFQIHDGHIYETLVGRGGVLVALKSQPRAADALATLHAYGGGNAAIGVWAGRL
jgi:hypothetical protein